MRQRPPREELLRRKGAPMHTEERKYSVLPGLALIVCAAAKRRTMSPLCGMMGKCIIIKCGRKAD